jgi:hypothetical protein
MMETTQLETAQLGSTGLEITRDHFDGDDYNLRVLIERMERMGSSEREIEVAVREASGCPSHPAGPHRTAWRRPRFRVIGRRLQGQRRLWKREESLR